MLTFLTNGSALSRFFIWVAISALVLGFIGNVQHNLAASEFSGDQASYSTYIIKILLDSLAQTFRIFFPRLKVAAGTDSWMLTIARALGGLASFAATIVVLWALFKDEIAKFRIVFQKNHAIIIGYDDLSEKFAASFLDANRKSVILLDIEPNHEAKEKCREAGFFYLPTTRETVGNTLNTARLHKARNIFINTGDDERNLTYLQEVVASKDTQNTSDLQIIVNIDSARLANQLQRNDALLELGGRTIQIKFFNFSRQSAINLIERTPFVDQALGRKQPHVNLVILGRSDTAVECAMQFLRISPALGLKKPHIDWIVDEVDELLGTLRERNEALGALAAASQMASGKKPKKLPLSWALDMDLHELPVGVHIPDLQLLEKIEKKNGGEITAIIVAERNDNENVPLAIALRERVKRYDLWQAPVYAWSQDTSALDMVMLRYDGEFARKCPPYLEHILPTIKPSAVLEPFGRSDAICRVDNLDGQREKIAKRVHEDYLEQRKSQTGNDLEEMARDASLKPWEEISETYRIASRRAADHIPVKLICAGIKVDNLRSLPRLSKKALETDNLLERLSELEHETWQIDRELDGWRWAKTRDNSKKTHPDIVPYEKLPDPIKEYDRAMVRLLTRL